MRFTFIEGERNRQFAENIRDRMLNLKDEDGQPLVRWAVIVDNQGRLISVCINRRQDDLEESYRSLADQNGVSVDIIRKAFEEPQWDEGIE